jgi:alpha-mannosidase
VDKDGNVSSIYDKVHKTETLSAPIKLAFQGEAPSIYPAWNMDWKDQQKAPYAYVDGPAKMSVVENGPVRYAIQIERSAQGSHFVQQVRLTKGSDRVEFLDNIDWKSTGCALKATFPLKASNPKATYNWQVGTVQRGNNDEKKYEVASQRWFDLTDRSGDFGASVLTGAKYGSDKPDDNTVRLTLLYSPTATGGFEEQAHQDWGHHEILYGLYPHVKDWRYAGTAQEAMRLDQPMNVFQAPAHPGILGRVYSALKISDDDVTAVALKKAEDSGRIVVRLREDNGAGRKGVLLSLPEGIVAAREVDGQERQIGPATVTDGKLVFNMTPYAVRAFELQVKPQATGTKTVSKPVALPYNVCATSNRANRAAGNFDGQGRSLAADQLPDTIHAEGVDFKIGPTKDGAKNAVACEGQEIELPVGDWQKIYILGASSKGDKFGAFYVPLGQNRLESKSYVEGWNIQDWGGYIGEWDTRVWKHPQKEVIYDWGDNPYEGLTPGFMKMAPVAWCCDHKHDAKGDEIYQYSYLFKYSVQLGTSLSPHDRTLRLPNDPSIKILAISVARNVNDDITPADALYDTLPRSPDHVVVTPAGGDYKDSKLVTIGPNLFGAMNQIKYSADGSAPNQAYTGPFWVSKTTTIKAEIAGGPVTTTTLNVDDTTAPTLTASYYWPDLNVAELRFSEPLDKLAGEEPTNYRIGDVAATAAHLSKDGQTVFLEMGPAADTVDQVRATAIVRDASENHNEANLEFQVTPAKAAYSLDHFVADGHEVTASPDGLPIAGNAPWSINFFIRPDKQIPDHTLIAGFGQVPDRRDGASRYLSMFNEGGLRFWGRNVDISTDTNLALNTWQMLTVTYDGSTLKIYKDGKLLTSAGAALNDAPNEVHIAPLDGWLHRNRFDSGEIANFSIWANCLDQTAVDTLLRKGHS